MIGRWLNRNRRQLLRTGKNDPVESMLKDLGLAGTGKWPNGPSDPSSAGLAG